MASPAPALARSWPLALRLLALAGAGALGLALQQTLAARLASIQALAETDVLAARRELAIVFRVAAAALVAGVGGLGLAIAWSCRRALAEGRFPPTGALAFGPRRVATGLRAQRLARTGLVLGALLFVCSAAAAGLLWWMARALLLCRAGAA